MISHQPHHTEILRISTLGATIVDYLLGGGVITSLSPATINLHPYTIAGYIGLVINALSLLPVGNTDGGRLCLVRGTCHSSSFHIHSDAAVMQDILRTVVLESRSRDGVVDSSSIRSLWC